MRFLGIWIAPVGLFASCSCGSEPSAPESLAGPRIDLLARRPELVIDLPGPVVPVGDVPGTTTFGPAEGPGWSKADLRLPDGTPYRVTNQAQAELVLTAPRPAARELVLVLWCQRPAGLAPARVHLALNDVALGEFELGREPAEVRVATPVELWVLGANLLELFVDPVERAGQPAWDVLALARLEYGPAAPVVLDTAARRARLGDGTGVRYALELAGPARLELAGSVTGPGVLTARLGILSPRNGELELASEAERFRASGTGPLTAELELAPRAGAVRVLELEWDAGGSAELELTRLDVRERAARPRPPIVFVSIDTFAARHLAPYGYARATTPELARFQADAVLFERCLANAPWTLPSYLSVLSGLYPRAHTVTLSFQESSAMSPHDLWQLADSRWTLAEALRARGYRTGAFVDTQWLAPIFRVNQGFDNYNGEGALAPFEDPHAHIEHIVERLVPPWLAASDADHPPFLFLHALDAHGPYLPNAPFRDAFTAALPDGRTHVAAGSDNQTYRWMPWWMSRTMQPDESQPEAPTVPLENVVARYDETLLKVDAYLGKLFEHLRERGLYDEAVIVVTGDHGEFFGPGAYGHGLMHEAVLHVPLLLKLPANAHGGTRVRAPVSLVDVYPTLLELAGLAPEATRLHGSSLLAHLGESTTAAERPLFSEGGHVEQYALTLGCWRLVEERPGSESSESSLLSHPRAPEEWLRAHFPEILTEPLTKTLLAELQTRPEYAARIAELRKLVAGPYYALFDLCTDGEQRVDRSQAEPERLKRMQALLSIEKERSRSAQREARFVGARLSLSEEALQQLEKLGYNGGDEGK
jgi:arylsulfatase A-like enzyme